MATIRERGPYQWQAQVIRKGQSSQYKTFNNKADAGKWARSIEAEMDRGIFIPRKEDESTTLEEALERFIKEHIPTLKTSYRETNRARAILRDTMAKRFLATFRGKDIADFIKRREENGISPKSRQPRSETAASSGTGSSAQAWRTGSDYRFNGIPSPGRRSPVRRRNGHAPIGTSQHDMGPCGSQEADSDSPRDKKRGKTDRSAVSGSRPDLVRTYQKNRWIRLGDGIGFDHSGFYSGRLPCPKNLRE